MKKKSDGRDSEKETTERTSTHKGRHELADQTAISSNSVPGAFAVAGIDTEQGVESDIESANQDVNRETASVMTPVSAQVVDTAEQDHRVQERVNQLLHEERQTAPFAQVVRGTDANCWPDTGRKRLVAVAFLLSAAVLAVILGVMLPRDPVVTEELKLKDLLASASFDVGAALKSPGTPQNKAYNWLRTDPSLGEYSPQRRLQRYALATFYFSTNGNNWKNNSKWLDRGHECGRWWSSQKDALNCENDAVTNLVLANNNLQGTIPEEIRLLADSLNNLHLFGNALPGPFPKVVGQLTNLLDLDLTSTEMTGSIPGEIKELTNLFTFVIAENQFTGTIPTDIFQLKTLKWLDLGGNDLTGTISNEIAMLKDLDLLGLWGNELGGTIPTAIGGLSLLEWIALYDNKLTGNVPSEITQLSVLEFLYLHNNRFTGRVPDGIDNMTTLKYVHLHTNELTGTFQCPDFIVECFVSCDDPLKDTCRML